MFCLALAEQLERDGWSVVCAALRHRHLPLIIIFYICCRNLLDYREQLNVLDSYLYVFFDLISI